MLPPHTDKAQLIDVSRENNDSNLASGWSQNGVPKVLCGWSVTYERVLMRICCNKPFVQLTFVYAILWAEGALRSSVILTILPRWRRSRESRDPQDRSLGKAKDDSWEVVLCPKASLNINYWFSLFYINLYSLKLSHLHWSALALS